MTRLGRLCVNEDDGDAVYDENELQRRAKLFEWVLAITSSMVTLILSQNSPVD